MVLPSLAVASSLPPRTWSAGSIRSPAIIQCRRLLGAGSDRWWRMAAAMGGARRRHCRQIALGNWVSFGEI
ncbi:hypothetical protein BCR44DRAFT_1426723 [Catenaria anguillulae PL171]|uniref:Uncharacterized protein n=1 Tax=Catenaria anguillulae PL171 TaxID=765915 RepID=A0A1Y2HY43_9FUNG|nr:hypothetical protein BCR44DRAFT_1426723 [Catenaria anguillulae PL171]